MESMCENISRSILIPIYTNPLFIITKNFNIDVMVISGMNLIATHNLRIPNYQIYDTNHRTRRQEELKALQDRKIHLGITFRLVIFLPKIKWVH